MAAGAYATVQRGGHLPTPTQADFWETFLRFCKSNHNRRTIESFLFRYFKGYRKTPTRLVPSHRHPILNDIDVEEVFTFISERIAAPATSVQLKTAVERVWESLTIEIGNVFSRFTANAETRRLY